jgi:hypothetical protein
MKTVTLILFVLIISTLSSFSQTDRRIVECSGIISEKYPIKMTLTIQGDKVLGFYYYEKYKTKILLSGNIDGTKMTLDEANDYPLSDLRIGFIGDFKDKVFCGVWTNKTRGKTLNFKASVDSDKPMNISDRVSKIEGTYEDVMNSDQYSGSLNLKYIKDDLFCFEISNSRESGCTGYLKGLINLNNLTDGTYSEDSCEEIEISVLKENELSLTEKDCSYHGRGCSFEGKYKKELQ